MSKHSLAEAEALGALRGNMEEVTSQSGLQWSMAALLYSLYSQYSGHITATGGPQVWGYREPFSKGYVWRRKIDPEVI